MLVGTYRYEGHTYSVQAYDFSDNIAVYLTPVTGRDRVFMDRGIMLPDGDVTPAYWDELYVSVGSGKVSVSCYIEEFEGKKYKNELNVKCLTRFGNILRGMKSACTSLNLETDELYNTGYVPSQINKYLFDNDSYIKLQMQVIMEVHYVGYDGVCLDLEEDGSYEQKINRLTNTLRQFKLDLSEFVKEDEDDDWSFDGGSDYIFSLAEIIERNPQKSYVWLKSRKYYIINTKEDIERVCNKIWNHKGIVAFDTETTGLRVNITSRTGGGGDRLVGMVFSIEPGEAWYIPICHKRIRNACSLGDEQFFIEKYFKPILENKELLCHNGSYDWKVMYTYGIMCNIVHDTYILYKVTFWNDHRGYELSLKKLTKSFLNRDSFELKDFVQGRFGSNNVKFWDLEEESVKYYACPDTDNLIELFGYAMDNNLLDRYGARKIYEIEVAFSLVIAYQEYYGHCVDVSRLDDLVYDIKTTKDDEYKAMVDIVGYDFNPNSSKDLQHIVFDELKYPIIEYTDTGAPSCGKGARKVWMEEENIDGTPKYPFAHHLHRWKEKSVLESNFTKNIDKLATKDGLMFSKVQQFLETGRLSVKNPNYQSYNDEVKKYITPRAGYYALDADYSSVEARIMVSMAGCTNMVNKLKDPDADYHTLKASDMFEVPYELVSHKLRKMSKGVNFGILYGLGDPNLGKNLYGEKTPENTVKAKHQKELYFKGMEELRDFIRISKEQGITQFYSTTYFDRRRYFDPKKVRKDTIERQSCNARIQGTAADIYKVAMVRLFHEIKKHGWVGKVLISGFIHDECFLEIHKSIDPCIMLSVLRKCMMLQIEGWCPLFIGAGFGRNWYEAKNTEIPVQVQDKFVDTWGTDGLDWWDGDTSKLYTWEVNQINNYKRDRVINYLKNQDNWNKVFSPVENSLAHEVLDEVKDGVLVEGTVCTDVNPSQDMVENLKEFCRVFGCEELFEKANVQKPVHKEKEEPAQLPSNVDADDLEELDIKSIIKMRINTLGVHLYRGGEGNVLYFRYMENNKPFMKIIRNIMEREKGTIPVLAVKDGEFYKTGLGVSMKAYPLILQMYMSMANGG